MTTSTTTRDRIETVIFTPTTSFDCCGGFKNDDDDDDSLTEYGYCPAPRERSVSYETMEELKDKLFLMYEEDEQENTYHHSHQQQHDEQQSCDEESTEEGGANNEEEECREEKEAENSGQDEDLLATAKPSPAPLRSILKNKYPTGTFSTNRYHSSSYSNKTTPPTTPRLPASGSTPLTKKRVRSTPTKKKNRLVRFLISSPPSCKTNG